MVPFSILANVVTMLNISPWSTRRQIKQSTRCLRRRGLHGLTPQHNISSNTPYSDFGGFIYDNTLFLIAYKSFFNN